MTDDSKCVHIQKHDRYPVSVDSAEIIATIAKELLVSGDVSSYNRYNNRSSMASLMV